MAQNEYKYNPISNVLDLVGGGSGSGTGQKFVGVTGILQQTNYNWARIAQFKFETNSSISSEIENISLDAQFILTKQNTNAYAFNYDQQSCKLDIHVQIPYIFDTDPQASHYTKMQIAMLDRVGMESTDVKIVESTHLINGIFATVYVDLYVKLETLFDRFLYSFISNADADQYGRIKVVPVLAENPVYAIYGGQYAKLYSNTYFEQSFSNVSSVTVDHNLNKFPAVVIMDENNNQVFANVNYNSLNRVVVSFDAAQTGKIICN